MNNIFFTSDNHFFHEKILEFEKEYRPFKTIEEHNEELIKRWNVKVGKRDVVYCLGDFCFGRKNLEIANELNGIKKLILGNHDLFPMEEYMKYFTKIYGCLKYKEYILTHIPVHESQKYRFKGNIHGHLHSKVVMKNEQWECPDCFQKINKLKQSIDPFYINVSIEQHDLAPVSFDEIKRMP